MALQFNARQKDVLTELVNIGMGKAAHTLNQIVGAHVTLTVPEIQVMHPIELVNYFSGSKELSIVRMSFRGVFSGAALLVFPVQSASYVVDILIGQTPDVPDLDMIRVGALTEVGNIVLNGVIGSLSNVFAQQIHYSIPTYLESGIDDLMGQEDNQESMIIMAHTHMRIEKYKLEGHIVLLFQVEMLDDLLDMLDELTQNMVK